jgi:putative heme iron utilization protein
MKPDPAFDARRAGKKLLREGRSGALATLMDGSGDPYCSLVNIATAPDGAPLLLISTLALHTKNILADNRVSLMLDERKDGDPLEGARVMLMGKAAAADAAAARPAYLRRHPEAKTFVDFPDFAFYRIELERAHLVAGFGRIVDLNAGDILTDMADAAPLMEAEGGAIDHINADHADALRLCATRLLGAPDGNWRCVGLNPDGIELQRERAALWLPFPQRVISSGGLRAVLKELVGQARAR